jgi:hypothetical protein
VGTNWTTLCQACRLPSMKATILSKIPESGTVREKHFDAQGDCTWVEFSDDKKSWVGVFGRGPLTKINLVERFAGTERFFVVACGQGYSVDTDQEKCLFQTEHDYIQSAIAVPNRDLIVTCDFTDLEVYSSDKMVWRSERVALDGIRLEAADDSKVRGHLWNHDGWYSFTLDMKQWALSEPVFVSADWDHFVAD